MSVTADSTVAARAPVPATPNATVRIEPPRAWMDVHLTASLASNRIPAILNF